MQLIKMFACTVCEVGETQFEDVLALVLKFEGNEFFGEIAAREDLTYGMTQRLKAQAQFTSLNCLDCKYRMVVTVSMEKILDLN